MVLAQKAGLSSKPTYAREGHNLMLEAGRNAHARQMRRSRGWARKLSIDPGRIIRNVERQEVPGPNILILMLRQQKQRQNQEKAYSVLEPNGKCIAKGEAGKKCEVGQKASLAVSRTGG